MWARYTSSTLKGDLRYTPTTAFATFPWPYPIEDHHWETVAELAKELFELRRNLCRESNSGLTKLYNTMEDGGYRELADLHKKLDVAVARCYGWEASVAQNPTELIKRLSFLNESIAVKEKEYAPFPKRQIDGHLGI